MIAAHLAAPSTCHPQRLPATMAAQPQRECRRLSASLPSCRLWQGAYYNLNNCESLVSCAAELQVSCRVELRFRVQGREHTARGTVAPRQVHLYAAGWRLCNVQKLAPRQPQQADGWLTPARQAGQMPVCHWTYCLAGAGVLWSAHLSSWTWCWCEHWHRQAASLKCSPVVQGLVLENEVLAHQPLLVNGLEQAFTEVKEFLASFSGRQVVADAAVQQACVSQSGCWGGPQSSRWL